MGSDVVDTYERSGSEYFRPVFFFLIVSSVGGVGWGTLVSAESRFYSRNLRSPDMYWEVVIVRV